MTKNELCLFILFSLLVIGCQAQEPVSIKIDLGNVPSDLPWNNLTNTTSGEINTLIDSRGLATSVSIVVSDAFNGINNSGTMMADTNLELPSTATGDSFFGNLVEFSGKTEPTAAVTLSGLDTDKEYDVSLFASRLATDNRETKYIVEGSAIDSALLQVADNIDSKVSFAGMLPDSNGEISISCTAGPNNDNGFSFYYLGAIELNYMDTVVVIKPELELVYPIGGEFWQSNKMPEIRWNSQGIDNLDLAYTIDDGATWIDIASVAAISQGYTWSPPEINTESAKIRLRSIDFSVQSDSDFTISSQDTSSCHIVVLGSSTAAGTGPSVRDSAWVWRYEDYIFQHDTRFDVTNLARGGFTTYNILPTGTTIPAGVDQTIDEDRNVTKARELNPDGIIINLPSNDAARGYSVEDQLVNYSNTLEGLEEDSISYWVATPQPRNGFSGDQKQIQLDMRDSTFSIFGDYSIDFWNGFDTDVNDLDQDFDSGDGVHMNDAGHLELFRRVLAKGVPDSLLTIKLGPTSSTETPILDASLRLYPNPTQQDLTIEWKEQEISSVQILNQKGELIKLEKMNVARSTITLDMRAYPEGLYYIKILNASGKEVIKTIMKN